MRFKKIKLVILCVLLTFMSRGQVPGFHGKKFSLSVGTTFNPAFVNSSDNYLNDSKIPSVLPPKVNLGLEYSVGKRTNLTLLGSYYAMPHSEFHIKNRLSNGNQTITIVDSFQMKSNMISLAAGFRRYSSFSHYGKFTSIGLSGNYFNTIIYPTIYRNTVNNGITTVNEIEKLPIGREWTYNLAAYVGRGKSHVFKNYVKVDYGVNLWIFLGQNNYDVTENYRDDVAGIVDHLMNKRARESHFLEIFVNVGILN